MPSMTRRTFVVAAAAAVAAPHRLLAREAPLFRISLAQWSLHRTFFGTSLSLPWSEREALFKRDPDRLWQGTALPIDFPVIARREYGLEAVEYVNTMMYGKADDAAWLTELDRRAKGEGVYHHLIMCDLEGALGDPDPAARTVAIENHVRWLRCASRLGCAMIRVNAQSRGTPEEQAKLAADGLRRLAERAEEFKLRVVVENHGGYSSRATWLVDVLKRADHPLLGTLPDFGNFTVSSTERYDAYRGVEEMMPMAAAVSAKSHDFGADGEEVDIDYARMLRLVLGAGFRGWIGVEYEGQRLPEPEGVRRTVTLLEATRAKLTAEFPS